MTDYCRYKNGPTVKCRVPMQKVPQAPPCEYAVEMLSELAGLPYAMSYVPMQSFGSLYEIDAAFCAGTLFKELDKPFGKGCQ